jgi:pimeloyl-ACP methyl ester carboxylesterase
LQHGFPDTPHTWSHLAPLLVDAGYRVVRPFGRGIHPSERPEGDAYAAEDLSGDLVGLIGALGEERAIIVGHDWGAGAAWGAAHLAPELIDKLVIVAIPHPATLKPRLQVLWGARHLVGLQLPGAAGRVRRGDFSGVRTFYERWSPGHEWPEEELESAKNAYAWPGCLEAALGYYRQLGRWPFRGRIEGVDTLVIGGLSDGVATQLDFERSVQRVPGAQVVMLPGGHFLHREHPEPFAEAVLAFLEE